MVHWTRGKETCKTVKGQQVKNSWSTSIRRVVSGLFLTFPISSSPNPPAWLGIDFVGSPSSTGCRRSIPTSSVGLSVRRRRNIPDKANFLRFSVDMVFVFTLEFKSNRTRNIFSLKLFLLTIFQFVYVIAQNNGLSKVKIWDMTKTVPQTACHSFMFGCVKL